MSVDVNETAFSRVYFYKIHYRECDNDLLCRLNLECHRIKAYCNQTVDRNRNLILGYSSVHKIDPQNYRQIKISCSIQYFLNLSE
jgi:uncharacterized protein (DUF2252 family)